MSGGCGGGGKAIRGIGASRRDPKDALQDALSVEIADNKAVGEHFPHDALQDDIAASARRLRQLGDDILLNQVYANL